MFLATSWRLRIGGMGTVIGVETAPMLRQLRRDGMDDDLAEDLIAACEGGLVNALNEKEGMDGEGA